MLLIEDVTFVSFLHKLGNDFIVLSDILNTGALTNLPRESIADPNWLYFLNSVVYIIGLFIIYKSLSARFARTSFP